MTGLEIVVLAPLAYGILHLGKKVVEQRAIIDNQMETLAQQQLALEAQRAAAAANGGGGSGGHGDTLLGKAMMVGSLGIAGAMTAYNFYRIRTANDRRRSDGEDEGSSADTTSATSNTNTLTSSSAVDGNGSGRSRNRRSHQPPPNYQPQEAKSEAEECKVCMHNQRDTLVTPCNHFALCWQCAEEIFHSATTRSESGRPCGGPCPVCRVPITSLQFAYVA